VLRVVRGDSMWPLVSWGDYLLLSAFELKLIGLYVSLYRHWQCASGTTSSHAARSAIDLMLH
jgi:hypothetical protein